MNKSANTSTPEPIAAIAAWTSTARHTPGQWEHGHTDHFDQSIDIWESKTSRTLCRTINSLPIEEQEANARLIAAAPDLLDACIAILTLDELEMGDESLLPPEHPKAMVKAAIAKARGL